MPDPVPFPFPSSDPAASAPPPPSSPPAAAPPQLLTFDEFRKVRLVTAEVLAAVNHPKADRLVILKVKTGERTRQIVAGLRPVYAPEALVGKTIILVDNLQPARLRGEVSEGMLLAVRLPDGGLRLLTTDAPAPDGLEVS